MNSPHNARTPMLRGLLALVAIALIGIGMRADAATSTATRAAVRTQRAAATIAHDAVRPASDGRRHLHAHLRKLALARR
jgi:hypothetical protein